MLIDGNSMENIHFTWDKNNKPVARIRQGETVTLKIPDSSVGQIHPWMGDSDLGTIDESKFDGALGPIFIEGATRGGTLRVDIESLESGNSGWSAIIDNFGLLKNRFPRKLVTWKKTDGKWSCAGGFLKNVSLEDRPFLGVIGTAPESGTYGMIPPQYFGGNMDTKILGAGSSLFLPVNVDGGLVSFGDPHGSQGDGEICGTAIETTATAKVKFSFTESPLKMPRVISKEHREGEIYSSSGISGDLHSAAENAVLDMIEYLESMNLSGEEAYILLSVTGNLSIREIVDEPNYVVTMSVPMDIIRQLK